MYDWFNLPPSFQMFSNKILNSTAGSMYPGLRLIQKKKLCDSD